MAEGMRVPSGQGGLIRYTEESTSKLRFSPGTIVVVAILIMALVILLNIFGMRLFS